MNIIESNDKKIYILSENHNLTEYIQENKKEIRKSKKTVEFRNRIELIQGFEFNTSSNKLKISKDKNYIMASGIYSPQIKIFDTNQMTLKCLRGVDSEIIDFKILTEDYKKVAMIQADRNIEIHAQYGKHFKIRVPKTPRCVEYNKFSANLIIGASSSQLYRLDLEEGKFSTPIEISQEGVNDIQINPYLDISLIACDNGFLEVNDYRVSKIINQVCLQEQEHLTVLQKSQNPFEFYVGTSEGMVKLYDLRYNKPVQQKRHPYMLPINSIQLNNKASKIITVDERQIRISEKDDLSKLFVNFEPKYKTNDLKIFGESGLILTANEHPKCGAFFIPSLGHAPEFCSFVENFTEELETRNKYDDKEEFRFVTLEELKGMNAENLVQSGKLKTHLHGFLIQQKLYNNLKAVSQQVK